MALRKDAGADLGDALRHASRVNDVDKIKSLITKGADVNTQYIGFTPLRWASMSGHKEAIAILIEHDARDDLHAAAARGDLEAMEALFAAGGVDQQAVNGANRGGETPLMWAASHASSKEAGAVAKLLIAKKANVNAKDQHGFTALMCASQSGHVETMQALIDARADINAREPEDDETALDMATHCARSDAVQLLLDYGAVKSKSTDKAPDAEKAQKRQSMSMRSDASFIDTSTSG